MALDATVMCNCLRDGKTSPSPFPADWLVIDDEGYLNLKPEYESDENSITLYQWEQTCCEHEGMDVASEWISNWSGYRLFQAALAEVGWQHFPVLMEQLPNVNGGLTPSAASAKAILELQYFESTQTIGEKTVLVDSKSGESLHEHVAAYDGVFFLAGSRGFNAGISEFEFFAKESETERDLFRATRFRQYTLSGEAIDSESDDVVWGNLDTGEAFRSGAAISGQQIQWEDGSWQKPDGTCRFHYPSEFHVERRARQASDFEYIVNALKTIFEASVATGNPVRWC